MISASTPGAGAAFSRGEVQKIILTRPAPYLRPLYNALYDMLDFEKTRAYIEQELIKILTRIKGIGFIQFSKEDVVRHKLVSDIINAYEKNE